MYDYRLPCVSLGLIIYLQTTFSRNCDLEFTDVPSKTYKADFVIEGMVHRIISSSGKGAGKGSKKESIVRFKVGDVFKGTLDKETNTIRHQTINVGRFGAKADPGRCIAPLPQIGSRYVLFLRSAETNNGSRMEKGEGELLRPDFVLSSFPVPLSDDVISSVRQSIGKKFGKKPTTRIQMKNWIFTPGQVARVQCSVTGQPKPMVIWFKDGVQIQSTKRISFLDAKRRSTLVIRRLSPTDSGIYRCQAVNVVGSSSYSTKGVLVMVTSPTTVMVTSPTTVMVTSPTTVMVTSPTTEPPGYPPHTKPCVEMDDYCFHGGVCRYVIVLRRMYCNCQKGFIGQRCEEKQSIHDARLVSGKDRPTSRKRRPLPSQSSQPYAM